MIEELNTTVRVTLTQLQTQLGNGPIFIGEDHSSSFAREAVIDLIEGGHVNKLFLELPNIENAQEYGNPKMAIYLQSINRDRNQELEQEILMTHNLMENMTRRKNEPPMGDLIQTALNKGGIAIYFHDVPQAPGGKFFIGNKTLTEEYASSIEGVIERNHYSAGIIMGHEFGPHTIILVGKDHLDPKAQDDQITLGQENTLQTLLGCDNQQAFDLTTNQIKQIGPKGMNVQNTQNTSNKGCCTLF